MPSSRLHKSGTERLLFGVCGGLAEHFDVDPVLVRLVFVLLAFASGAGVLIYLVLVIIMPKEESSGAPTAQVVRENLQSIPGDAAEAGRRVSEAVRGVSPVPGGEQPPEKAPRDGRPRRGLALLLVVVGTLLLLANLGAFWWFRWSTLWPLILIALGIAILIGWFGRR